MITEQIIDALNIGAADAEVYGYKVQSALSRAWKAALDGDVNEIEDAIEDAKREDAHFRGIMLNVREALRDLEHPTKPEALTDEEVRQLILALGQGQPGGFSNDDAERVIYWAKEARIKSELLTMLLDQRLCVSVSPDGDVLMGLPKGGEPARG